MKNGVVLGWAVVLCGCSSHRAVESPAPRGIGSSPRIIVGIANRRLTLDLPEPGYVTVFGIEAGLTLMSPVGPAAVSFGPFASGRRQLNLGQAVRVSLPAFSAQGAAPGIASSCPAIGPLPNNLLAGCQPTAEGQNVWVLQDWPLILAVATREPLDRAVLANSTPRFDYLATLRSAEVRQQTRRTFASGLLTLLGRQREVLAWDFIEPASPFR